MASSHLYFHIWLIPSRTVVLPPPVFINSISYFIQFSFFPYPSFFPFPLSLLLPLSFPLPFNQSPLITNDFPFPESLPFPLSLEVFWEQLIDTCPTPWHLKHRFRHVCCALKRFMLATSTFLTLALAWSSLNRIDMPIYATTIIQPPKCTIPCLLHQQTQHSWSSSVVAAHVLSVTPQKAFVAAPTYEQPHDRRHKIHHLRDGDRNFSLLAANFWGALLKDQHLVN